MTLAICTTWLSSADPDAGLTPSPLERTAWGEITPSGDRRLSLMPMCALMASLRTRASQADGRSTACFARLSDESGLALVLALLIVAALSITTAAMIMLVTSNETSVGRDRQEERAFNVAEAGLNEAVSYLSNQNTLSISSVAPTNFSLDSGSGQWEATKTSSTTTVDTWTLYSKATVGKTSRKVSVQLAANKSRHQHPVVRDLGQGLLRRRQERSART